MIVLFSLVKEVRKIPIIKDKVLRFYSNGDMERYTIERLILEL